MTGQRLAFLCCFLLTGTTLFAQPLWWMGQKKPYKWQFGLGWNAVDDDGRAFCQPFDVKQSWNLPVFPSRIMVDRYLKKGFSIEFAGAYNNYLDTKLINDTVGLSGVFISTDLNAKLSFYQLIGLPWLDPYVSLGIGATDRQSMYPKTFLPNANASLGVNFWVWRNWGIQLQTSAKFGITSGFPNDESDYLQHTAGIMYRVVDRNHFHSSPHKKRYKWTKSTKYKGGRKKRNG